jgi:hypothetical protein
MRVAGRNQTRKHSCRNAQTSKARPSAHYIWVQSDPVQSLHRDNLIIESRESKLSFSHVGRRSVLKVPAPVCAGVPLASGTIFSLTITPSNSKIDFAPALNYCNRNLQPLTPNETSFVDGLVAFCISATGGNECGTDGNKFPCKTRFAGKTPCAGEPRGIALRCRGRRQ